MIHKNLLRRSGRTILTVLGVSVGVAVIIALGTMADGLEAGYGAVIAGAKADLIVSSPDAYDITLSSVDQDIGEAIVVMPEVEEVAGMIQGMVSAEGVPYFFIFGYPDDSFAMERFQIIDGVALNDPAADAQPGTPVIVGSQAIEVFDKSVGDMLRLGDSAYRIVGVYETGDAFEEGGAVMRLEDAQVIANLQRSVSAFYIKLKDPTLADRVKERFGRIYPDLQISTSEDLADQSSMSESLRAMVWGIAVLTILIGGVGMMNAQLMSVMERTREIGVLRAVGWKKWRVMVMILGESLIVCLLGGLVGVALAFLMLYGLRDILSAWGASLNVEPQLYAQAFSVVIVLGLIGGLYPAYRAARMQPIEALRYEGGSTGKNNVHLPVGGMAVQNLNRRKFRTLLTLGMIGITVGAVTVLDALLSSMKDMMGDMAGGSEIIVRDADTPDLGYSSIDERIGDRIAAMPEVKNVSGMIMSVSMNEDTGMFILLGYSPHEASIYDFNIVEGERISGNRQMMVGRSMSEAADIGVGDNITIGDIRYRVVGIYEHSMAWLEMGGVASLRDVQNFAGKPRQVMMYNVDLHDPKDARAVVEKINASYPEVHAALSGEFADTLPDLQNSQAMSDAIAFLALLVGGVGMMNTMLMSVLERTREIGVLRALGWRRRAILSLIIRESLFLGVLGALVGVGVALLLGWLGGRIPTYGEFFVFNWTPEIFIKSVSVALLLGMLGGLVPAIRATRLQPVEALRYE
ncbi:MAG: ABC transporter permease [Anaerolineae bacterium]|nr:ABC transporter permease [Anaerolineae bacterium]